MVIALAGVTGVGKSYLKNQIHNILGIDLQTIVTTRKKREGEVEGIDKKYVTDKEFEDLKNKKEIVATFEMLGNKYGYPRNQMESDSLSVVELHYSNIYKFRKEVKDIFAIYMIPKNIETAIQKLKERNLSKEVEIKRIEEIKEHIENFKKDKNLREQFDYILYNDYTENTVKEIIQIVKNKTNEFLQKSIQV